MKIDFWLRLSDYFAGGLGSGALLEVRSIFIFFFALSLTLGFGLLSIARIVTPFSTKGMFLLCIVPSVLITPLLVHAFMQGQDHILLGSAVLSILVVPATWALPALSIYYGTKLAKGEHGSHPIGYSAVLLLEIMAVAFRILPYSF